MIRLTVSLSIAQPLVGWSVAVQPATVSDGVADSCGSPPPPTCALLITVLPAVRPASTPTCTLKALLPPAAIAVELVQVIS